MAKESLPNWILRGSSLLFSERVKKALAARVRSPIKGILSNMDRHWEDGKLGLSYAGSWGKIVKFPPRHSVLNPPGSMMVACMFHSGANSARKDSVKPSRADREDRD